MSEPAKDQLAAIKLAIAERRYDEAIRAARRLVIASAHHPEARLLLGEALLASERYDEARVELLALTRSRPNDARAHRLLGEAHLRGGRIDEARVALTHAASLDPSDEATQDLIAEASMEIAPVSATVERWMAAAEPPTIEMAMPEFRDAGGAASGAGLRALLERAAAKTGKGAVVPRPRGGVGADRQPSPGPRPSGDASPAGRAQGEAPPAPARELEARGDAEPGFDESVELESASMELELDDAREDLVGPSTTIGEPALELAGGSTSIAAPTPSPRGREAPTRELPAPEKVSQTMSTAPRGRPSSVPPPPPHRAGTTTPGGLASPVAREEATRALAPRPRRTPTLPGITPAPDLDASAAPPPPSLGPRPSAPPPPSLGPRPSAPPPPSLGPRPSAPPPPSLGPRPSAPPPPSLGPRPSAPPPALHRAPAPRSASLPHAAPPSSAPLPSESTVITATGEDPSGDAEQAAVTLERRALGQAPFARGEVDPAAVTLERRPLAPAALAGASPGPARYVAVAPAPRLGAAAVSGPSAAEPPTKPTLESAPDPTRRVRITQISVAAVLGGIVAFALGIAIYHALGVREREEAIASASDDGTAAAMVRALELTEGLPATRARLFATATVELGEDRADAAQALLASAAPGPEATVARSLLALAAGQAEEALMMLEGLEASDVTLVEGARARALALIALGRFDDAQAAATRAYSFRPGGARHACLAAHAAILTGRAEDAASVIEAIPNGDLVPCVRVVRAELALLRHDPTAVDAEVGAILGPLEARATRDEQAWAHHLGARAAAERGPRASARDPERRALELAPRADETLLLRALSGLLEAGDPEGAEELSARLAPSAPDPARRAAVLVDVALARRDLERAEGALRALAPGPRTDLASARVLEARGDADGALLRYTAASVDPALLVEASLRRGRLLNRLGRYAEARSALEAVARQAPADPEFALAMAEATLALGDVAAARRALEPALAALPDDARLLAASALARARGGEAQAALGVAQRAASGLPDDARVQLTLAEVARLAGDHAVEASACEAALRLDPEHPTALACGARMALEAGELARASELLERARARHGDPRELARLEAAIAVAAGRGQSAIERVRALLRAQPRDASLLVSLARLQLQAEAQSAADATARQALALVRDEPDALYVRAYAAYVAGRLGTASDLLDDAERSARSSDTRARVTALRGLLAYDDGRYGNPRALADRALALDPRCGIAFLVRALAAEGDRGAQRAALEGVTSATDPPAEAIARLAKALGASADGCALVARYVSMAPSGYDRRDIDALGADCR